MILNIIQPKNETKDLLISINKNCETLIEQTHRKAEEILEFIMIKRRETFHFNPPFRNRGDWMLGSVDLEGYISFFNKTEENNKFEFYKIHDEKSGCTTYEKVRDEIERDLDISDITAAGLQDDIIGPIIIKEFREEVTKKIER